MVAVSLLSGVVILARPESLFQSDQLDTNYDLVGLMSALAVPCLSALIVIITRQVSPNHLVTCLISPTSDRPNTSTTPCWSSGLVSGVSLSV